MSKKIVIAKIVSPFGIKGEVKIIVYSDDHLNIEKYRLCDAKGKEFRVGINNKNKAAIGTSNGDPIVIAKIDGVNDRNASELLRGVDLFADRAEFAPTKKNEFYYSDLIGLEVVNSKLAKIGEIADVQNYGAGGILEIKFTNQQVENFPFRDEIFPEVDLDKGFIRMEEIEIINAKKD